MDYNYYYRKVLIAFSCFEYIYNNAVFMVNTIWFHELKAEFLLFECLQQVSFGLLVWLLVKLHYTVKKSYHFFRPQPGCHLPNSPWLGIIKLFPTRESLVSDIPAGDGKNDILFYSVLYRWPPRDCCRAVLCLFPERNIGYVCRISTSHFIWVLGCTVYVELICGWDLA